jgi:hypothetical protein
MPRLARALESLADDFAGDGQFGEPLARRVGQGVGDRATRRSALRASDMER